MICINPYKDYDIDERCRLIIRDRKTEEYIVSKIIDRKSTMILNIDEFNDHWNYRFKFQIRGIDPKTGKERWIDYTNYKFFYPERINEDGMKYLLYENEKSNKLIVVFQAVNKTPSYNYVGALKDFSINRLYIKDDYGKDSATKLSYYLGSKKTLIISENTQKLIKDVANKLNIKKENTIFAGSSKGGFASIYHGYLFGAGYIVAGGPQILLGDYLYSGHDEKSIGKEIFKSVIGDLNEENLNWGNSIISNVIKNTTEPYPKTFIHVGYWEPHYSRHVEPFMKIANELNIKEIELNIATYKYHNELPQYFPNYLKDTVKKIIDL